MIIHVVTLFPESIRPYLESSIMRRAQDKGLFEYTLHNLADWTVKNTRRVDDRPYGGGAGTIITIEPLNNCLRDLIKDYGECPIWLMSPRGELLTQEIVQDISEEVSECIIICGHYEGVDERIFSLWDIREISIGQYVLSSGELASLVVIDSIIRLLPGVISKESLAEESYSPFLDGKKEYPHYSRPESYEGLSVPSVLLSGDLKKIAAWKKENLR